jgi:hypothetical protein
MAAPVKVLVNFDDLSTTGAGSPIPLGFDGFDWSAGSSPLWVITNSSSVALSGYEALARLLGTTNSAFEPVIDSQGDVAQPIDIHRVDNSPFFFNSVYIASAWDQEQSVTLTGYDSHGNVFGKTVLVNNQTPTLVSVHWGPIVDLKISNTEVQGPPPSVGGDPKMIALNDFSFTLLGGSTSSSEPSLDSAIAAAENQITFQVNNGVNFPYDWHLDDQHSALVAPIVSDVAALTNSNFLTDPQGYIFQTGYPNTKQCVALVLGLDNDLPSHTEPPSQPGNHWTTWWTNGAQQVDLNGLTTTAGFNPNLLPGTPIATFMNVTGTGTGQYPSVNEHAAMFLGYGSELDSSGHLQAGFFVLDQYYKQAVTPSSEPAEVRFIGFSDPYAHTYWNIIAHT